MKNPNFTTQNTTLAEAFPCCDNTVKVEYIKKPGAGAIYCCPDGSEPYDPVLYPGLCCISNGS